MSEKPSVATSFDHPGPADSDKFDVAVVGGGITGLSTALHCAECGLLTIPG